MVKASELRIGNKFSGIGMIQTVKEILDYGPTGSIQSQHNTKTESSLGYEHLILVKENRNQYKPVEIDGIPLTPEILLACGFKEQGGRFFYSFIREYDELRSYIFVGRVDSDPPGMYYYGFSSPVASVNINNIYFLHQLQNIILDLTGKELIYKPTPQPA